METQKIGLYNPTVGYYEAIAPVVKYPEPAEGQILTQKQIKEAERDAWLSLMSQQLPGTVRVFEMKPGEGFEFNGSHWIEQPTAVSAREMKEIVDRTLDTIAQARGYDNRHSIVAYAMSTNPTWVEEALAFIAYRDKMMTHLIDKLNAIDGGEPLPDMQQFTESLPNPPWAPAE